MRFTLPESARRPQRSAAGTVLSALLHGMAISASVSDTAMSAERAPRHAPLTEQLVYVKPMVERSAPRAVTQPPALTRAAAPIVPPERFITPELAPTISAHVPATIPDVSASLFTSTSVAATVSRDGGASGISDGVERSDASAPWSAYQVEREVVALRGGQPRYPEQLSRAGVEGTVVARFVVDTTGRVEQSTIEIARADQALFEQSVREALVRMRFTPAEAGGRKVRQLVEQPFTFALRSR